MGITDKNAIYECMVYFPGTAYNVASSFAQGFFWS